jgi:hypothetical protein
MLPAKRLGHCLLDGNVEVPHTLWPQFPRSRPAEHVVKFW